MPEDTEQPQSDIEPVEPPNLSDSDAPPQMPPMPGQTQLLLNEEGLLVQTITQPQVVTIKADKDTMRQIVSDWLAKHDEEFWDVLVKARLEVLRQRQKSQLAIVPDMKTAHKVARRVKGLQA